MRKIDVLAVSGGWKVVVEDVTNDMLFRSGKTAEAAARDLALRLAEAGEASEVRIYLRDGRLAARFLSPAAAPQEHADASG